MRHRIIFLALMLMAVGTLQAQDDFGLWASFAGSHKFNKQWSVGVEGELRSCENASQMERWSLGVDADYKIMKHLKASVGYVFMDNRYPEKVNLRKDETVKWSRPAYWTPRHRLMASLTGDLDLGRFNISLRERWQYTHRTAKTVQREYYTPDGELNYIEDDFRESKDTHVLRSRLQVEYDIKKCPVVPFASVELTNNFSGFNLEKTRYTAGAEWKLTKQHTVGLCYIYQNTSDDNDDDDVNSHILSISYKVKF